MISAIIPTLNNAYDLQILLGALVPAAVKGLVREVIVADGGSTDDTAAICEDCGADLAGADLLAAARLARHDWLLLAPVSLRLRGGWEDLLSEHLRQGGGRALVEGLQVRRGLLAGLSLAIGVGPAAPLVERQAFVDLGPGADIALARRRLARGAVVLR